MAHRIITRNIMSRVLFILVFAASLGVFYLTRTGESVWDFAINLVFAAIAAGFLIGYFAGCARPVSKLALALVRVTEDIRDAGEEPKALWSRYSRNPAPFDNRRLDERWCAYVREVYRLQKQNSLAAACRIDDYINEELVYAAVNKPFADQVGGIMSGLGILFTFIGLVYGLRNFDASSVDVMQSSTQALMSGIKIAFLTSIFGLIYSLLHGLFYKRLLKDSMEALYDFQDAFAESVRPMNEHAGEDALIRLQMEQNEALERFGAGVGEQISEAVVTLMGPAVETLRQTISQYVTVAIEDQRAGMDKVVRYFLESMNSSLGNIFVQLKTRTEELSRWQKDMIDAISSMTAGMEKTGKGFAESRAEVQRITETMAAYTDSIEALTAAQRGVTEDMKGLLADYQASRRQEQAYMQGLVSAADAAGESAKQSLATAQSVAAMAADIQTSSGVSAQQITEAGRQVHDAAQTVRSLSDAVTADLRNASERLERAVGELEGNLSRSTGDSVAMLDEAISRLSGALSGVTAASGSVSQALGALPKTVSGAQSNIRDTSKAIDTELKLLLKAVSDTQKSLSKFSADMERRV